MFLMNAPPVLALQSTWEPFCPPGAFRFPGCLSEPAEGVGGTSVHMLIRSLRRGHPAASALALGSSPERGLQRCPPSTSPAKPRVSCGPATVHPDLVQEEEEEAAAPDPPAPDSDSDDSVDRAIEEAIQEYLKAKGSSAQHPSATHSDRRCPPQPLRAAPTPSRPAPGPGLGCNPPGSTSPGSASSEDSFEQSIRTEIEQFLSEKKQLEVPKGPISADKKTEPAGGLVARPVLRARKEPELTVATKEFVFRKSPRLARIPSQPRNLRSKATPESEPGGTKPTTTCSPSEAAQTKGGLRRGAGRRSKRGPISVLVPEAPDSSSDDGIEEAIQLYQLEKQREAGGSPAGTGPTTRSTFPESHKKTATSTRKPLAGKVMDVGPAAPEPGLPTQLAQEGRCGPCCADPSTELLCAEAILDISKAILPATPDSREQIVAAGLPSPQPPVPWGSDSGGGSSVDSDDSIEQEIQAFLALKAQAGESALAESGSASGQAGDLRAPLPQSLALSLSCKRRRGAGSHVPTLTSPKEGTQEAGLQLTRMTENPVREGTSRGHPTFPRTGGPMDETAVPETTPTGLSLGPRRTVETRGAEEKESSGDKSSSLDSDEDLDTAIKDLLRSKRKRQKRWRDPRAAPRMKVQLGTAPKLLHRLGGLRRAWKHRGSVLWRSCFPKSRRGHGTPSSVPLRGQTQEVLPAPRAQVGTFFAGSQEPRCPAPSPSSASDDSSVDSDDSIELEIRKFLSEKAKEALPEPGRHPCPEMLCPKVLALPTRVCTRSQRGRGAAQSIEAVKSTGWARATSPACAFGLAGQSNPRTDPTCLPSTPTWHELAPPRSTKASLGNRRHLYVHRDQSPRVTEPVAGDSTLGPLLGCATGESLGQGLAAEKERRTPGGLALPWADFTQQSRLQSTWGLNLEGRGGVCRGALGSQWEKGVSPSPVTLDPKKGLPFAGFSPLLPTQLFHFGKSVSWGAKQTGLFSSPLSMPLQGPSFSAFQGAQPAHGPIFGTSSLLLKKEGGCWPPARAQVKCGMSHRSLEEGTVGVQYRQRSVQREEKEQEALGSGASELSDSSVEEGASRLLARGKDLEL